MADEDAIEMRAMMARWETLRAHWGLLPDEEAGLLGDSAFAGPIDSVASWQAVRMERRMRLLIDLGAGLDTLLVDQRRIRTWTALYRSRLFDADQHVTPAERSERKALVEAIGFDPMKAPCPGFFADTSPRGQSLTRAYRRLVSRARFVFPAEDLRHTLAVGRVVMRPELMRGMRIGESSQARTDEGAFDFRKFNGKIYYYLAAVPKMAFGRSRRMVLDPTTVMAFDRVREIAVERWFAAEGDMPVRAYHFAGKKLADARYLLANDTRTLIYAEMNLCLRVLTLGVISSASHSYKYGFAAMMKRGEAPDQILNRGLNHQMGSQNSEPYARFFTEHMVDAFIAEQQEESRKLELDYTLLEGVA